MAEGLVNHFLANQWEAHSAGMEATSVHPKAMQVMDEIGIDISQKRSKSLEHLPSTDFDLVVTLCSDAEQKCPLYLGQGKRVHIGFDNPAATTGTEEEILDAFRRVRDQITEKVLSLLRTYEQGMSEVGIQLDP